MSITGTYSEIIEDGRNAFTRVMAGSVPPGNEDLWKHARSYGYETDCLKRVADDDTGKLVEQGVDEALHLKIANTLLDYDKGTLVVVSGDGTPSHVSTSFPDQVRRALKRGWSVEVWSWGGATDWRSTTRWRTPGSRCITSTLTTTGSRS